MAVYTWKSSIANPILAGQGSTKNFRSKEIAFGWSFGHRWLSIKFLKTDVCVKNTRMQIQNALTDHRWFFTIFRVTPYRLQQWFGLIRPLQQTPIRPQNSKNNFSSDNQRPRELRLTVNMIVKASWYPLVQSSAAWRWKIHYPDQNLNLNLADLTIRLFVRCCCDTSCESPIKEY